MGRNSEIVVASQDTYSMLANFSLWNSWSWLIRLQIKILPPFFGKSLQSPELITFAFLIVILRFCMLAGKSWNCVHVFVFPNLGRWWWTQSPCNVLLANGLLVLAICVNGNYHGKGSWLFFLMSNWSHEARICLWPGPTDFLHGNSLECSHKVLLVTNESYNDA